MQIKAEVTQDKGSIKTLQVTVPVEEISRIRQKHLRELATSARIKGFRQGKVPVEIVESYYGLFVKEKTLDTLLDQAFEEALKQVDIKEDALRARWFYLSPFNEKKGYEFSVKIALLPDVDPDVYLGLEVEVEPKADITQERIEARIQELLEEARELKPKNGPIEPGNYIEVVYSRYKEGEEEPLIKDMKTMLPIPKEEGEELLIEGFKELLIGKEKGFEFDITGKNIVGKGDRERYRLVGKVEEVYELVLPELNEETLKRFGVTTREELEEKVKKELEEKEEEDRQSAIRQAIQEKLVELYPPAYDEEEEEVVFGETLRYFRIKGKKDLEEYFDFYRTLLWKDVVLYAIADKEGIKLEEEEFLKFLEEKRDPYRKLTREDVDKLAKEYIKTKTLGLLARYAKVKEKEPEEEDKDQEEVKE